MEIDFFRNSIRLLKSIFFRIFISNFLAYTLRVCLVSRLQNFKKILDFSIQSKFRKKSNERQEVEKLLDQADNIRKKSDRMTIFEADKGYDADWLRQALLVAKIFPLIPYRKTRGRKIPEMAEVCRVFNLS
jgi:hypothetical protein